jgi:hypothetical protein
MNRVYSQHVAIFDFTSTTMNNDTSTSSTTPISIACNRNQTIPPLVPLAKYDQVRRKKGRSGRTNAQQNNLKSFQKHYYAIEQSQKDDYDANFLLQKCMYATLSPILECSCHTSQLNQIPCRDVAPRIPCRRLSNQ